MASPTNKTEYRRKIRHDNAGKARKAALRNHGTTPAFPLHTAEADANAPDQAKRVAKD